jgi:hypothetical protein
LYAGAEHPGRAISADMPRVPFSIPVTPIGWNADPIGELACAHAEGVQLVAQGIPLGCTGGRQRRCWPHGLIQGLRAGMAGAAQLFAIGQLSWGYLVSDPITVTISHQLGRDEAKRRLENGLGYIRDQLIAFVSPAEYGWTGYRLDFSIAAMRQSIIGSIHVEDHVVRVELGLPFLLKILSESIIGRVHSEGVLLLNKPSG